MIVKFYDRVGVGGTGGWRYLDHVRSVEKYGPIRKPDSMDPVVFESHEAVVAWAHATWGDPLPAFSPLVWPQFRQGSAGCGGQSDAYQITCARVSFEDDSIGLVFLTQDDAFLMSDDGKTIDRLT